MYKFLALLTIAQFATPVLATEHTLHRELIVPVSFGEVVSWCKANYSDVLEINHVINMGRNTVNVFVPDKGSSVTIRVKVEEAAERLVYTTSLVSDEAGNLQAHNGSLTITPDGDETKITLDVYMKVRNSCFHKRALTPQQQLRVVMSTAYVKLTRSIMRQVQ